MNKNNNNNKNKNKNNNSGSRRKAAARPYGRILWGSLKVTYYIANESESGDANEARGSTYFF